MNEHKQKKLRAMWPSRVQFNVSMAAYSTLRAGGQAAALIELHALDELQRLLLQLNTEEITSLIIGRGSNILVADSGYPGVIIRLLGAFNTIAVQKNARGAAVRAGAGCPLATLVSWCTGHGLSGLEFMVGIPGSVGGAVRMNAGAWGEEIGVPLQEIETVDCKGHIQYFSANELRPTYRRLELADGSFENMVITSAVFQLERDQEEQIRSRCRSYLDGRRGKQPVGVASAGSFFKNPQGDSAGRLIEAAGLKGFCCGQAMVSPVHANFIVNQGKATATEIITLMEQVQQTVFQQFAVRLQPEVHIFQ
ncbi:MAG: UDP-N-acetylmuramate dehydrogenase [Candidatus Electrothrix sp. AR3]|nr:UDP-N-acetylmuramate dehydrogenase [Candidatus Electrothrix sp. AR3]